ncbi:hypothetical protein HDZ31DRAFT_69825 [Schizophyllum fasciatum]
MAAPAPRKINIAIVGAGIGGLSLALAIPRFCDMSQLDVHIYESAAQISEIGAGITVWERVYDILADLGIEEEFSSFLREDKSVSFRCRKSDQPQGEIFRDVLMDESGELPAFLKELD